MFMETSLDEAFNVIMGQDAGGGRWKFSQTSRRDLVTGHNEPVFGGERLSDRLSRERDLLVDAMLARMVADVPIYARLPTELLQGDVRSSCERAMGLFAETARDGEPPSAHQLDELTESAERRAEEGVPMEMVLDAYQVGTQVAFERILPAAVGAELAELPRMQLMMTQFLRTVTNAVATGYARHARATLVDEAASHQLLTNALVEGGDPVAAAERAGLRLATAYVVVAFAVGPHPDEVTPGTDAQVAGRRKLRRLRQELQRQLGEPVLWLPNPDGGLALLPEPGPVAQLDGATRKRLASMAAHAERAAGAPLHAGVVPAAREEVPAAARLARELVDLVVALGRPAGVHGLDDVLLEYQLSRPSPARSALAALLDPLAAEPDLLETLRVYLAESLSRRRAALRLHVHPNTVDNRLRKATLLTGLDVTSPADLPRIHAAITARAVLTGDAGQPSRPSTSSVERTSPKVR
jgi:hypothetical protein